MDCAIDWTNSKTVWVSGDEMKLKKRIMRLVEQCPDDVVIKARPEDNHGTVVVTLPKNWIQIAPPRKCRFTDEQRRRAAERMKNNRRRSSKSKTAET